MERMEAAARQLAGSRLAHCGHATSRRIRSLESAPGLTRSWRGRFAAALAGTAGNSIGKGDQLSNLEEEDLRAIIAYVRLLSPINRAVPLPRAPAADDCETYTFYLDRSDRAGCH
jgi:hypothetical protein